MATSKSLSEIGPFLEERARQGAPIFYNDLAKPFGLPPVTEAWFSHPLCNVFATLDDADQAKGRPFRTALVVSRERGIPGEGFFKTLAELRGTPYPIRNEVGKLRIADMEGRV